METDKHYTAHYITILKKRYLDANNWVEILDDNWVHVNDIREGKLNYYMHAMKTDQAYAKVYEDCKKSTVLFNGVSYQLTTDPYKVNDWVHVPNQMIGYEEVLQVTEENINVLPTINAMKIIAATDNKGMKGVSYMVIDPSPEKQHLEFIYDRLLHLHNENEDVDYMVKLKSIISRMQ